MLRNTVLAMLIAFGAVTVLSACDQEGPAEEAGEKIDNSMEKAGDKMEQAGDKIEQKADEAKQ